MGTVQNESLVFLEKAMGAVGLNQVTDTEYGALLLGVFGSHGLDVFFQYPPGTLRHIIITHNASTKRTKNSAFHKRK